MTRSISNPDLGDQLKWFPVLPPSSRPHLAISDLGGANHSDAALFISGLCRPCIYMVPALVNVQSLIRSGLASRIIASGPPAPYRSYAPRCCF